MSIGLRKFRATIYSYGDQGSMGATEPWWDLQSSGAADDAWWCSKSQPTGHEATIGMAPEHHVDVVFAFSASAPVTETGAIVCDGVTYKVRSILRRDYGTDEVQVLAERATEVLTDIAATVIV